MTGSDLFGFYVIAILVLLGLGTIDKRLRTVSAQLTRITEVLVQIRDRQK